MFLEQCRRICRGACVYVICLLLVIFLLIQYETNRPPCREKPVEYHSVTTPPRTDVLATTPWLAPIVWNGTYNREVLNAALRHRHVRIGVSVFAMKKYIVFLKTFLETAERFFMVGLKVNYYIFTDHVHEVPTFKLADGRQLIVLQLPAYKRWQDVSMRRMEMIFDYSRKQFAHEVDYLLCVDVDMEFTDEVGVEILSDLIGAIHPGFFRKTKKYFPYERRPTSQAYIPYDEGDFYYAGGCFGGTVEEIIKLTNYCHHATLADKQKNIEPLWHDESYINKYFFNYKPTKLLSPEYIWLYYFGDPAIVQTKRIVGVDKSIFFHYF